MWATVPTVPTSPCPSPASPRSRTGRRWRTSPPGPSRPAARPSGCGPRSSTGRPACRCRPSRWSDQTSTLHTLFLTELAVTAGALVLALAGGWWLVRLGLRPLEDVERTADSIAAGNLDQRVPGRTEPTEVGRLARALNVMLERIQAAFSARVASEARLRENEQHLRQFVADASHELRTPIAAVSAYAELFERGAAQHAEDLPAHRLGHPHRDGPHGPAGERPAHPGPPGRGRADADRRPSSWSAWRPRPCTPPPRSGPSGRCGSPRPVRSR